MPSFRVPNFISFYDFTAYDHYHLFEGYGVNLPDKIDIKPSGKYYQRIWMPSKEDLLQLLDYMGYSCWWEKYEPDTSFLGKMFGRWKIKVKEKL